MRNYYGGMGYGEEQEKETCVYLDGSVCGNPACPYLARTCKGKNTCEDYRESSAVRAIGSSKEQAAERKRLSREDAARADRFRISRQQEAQRLMALGEKALTERFGAAKVCPVCSERLDQDGNCAYCGLSLAAAYRAKREEEEARRAKAQTKAPAKAAAKKPAGAGSADRKPAAGKAPAGAPAKARPKTGAKAGEKGRRSAGGHFAGTKPAHRGSETGSQKLKEKKNGRKIKV